MLDYSRIFALFARGEGIGAGVDVCSLPCADPNAAQSEVFRLDMLLAPTVSALNVTKGIRAESRPYVAQVERVAGGALGCAPDSLVVTLDIGCSGVRFCGGAVETAWTQSYDLSFVDAQRALLQNRRSRQIVWESEAPFESKGRLIETKTLAQAGAEALFRLVVDLRPDAADEAHANLKRMIQRRLAPAGSSFR